MNTLHSQQMWDLMRAHHADLLKEAQQEQLAKLAMQSQTHWWQKISHRQAQKPTLALNPSTAPELN